MLGMTAEMLIRISAQSLQSEAAEKCQSTEGKEASGELVGKKRHRSAIPVATGECKGSAVLQDERPVYVDQAAGLHKKHRSGIPD